MFESDVVYCAGLAGVSEDCAPVVFAPPSCANKSTVGFGCSSVIGAEAGGYWFSPENNDGAVLG